MAEHYTILGAKGFIGSRLAKALKSKKLSCFTPVRGDPEIFSRFLGTVFYCIGLTNDYKDRPHDTVEAHVSLLNEILAKADFERLVYLSSTRLYDGLATTKENSDLILNPANPRHLYDLSKALSENLCLTAGQNKCAVARLSSVYDDAPDAAGFIPSLLQRLKQEKKFTLESSSGAVRDYIHVDDVVSGLIYLSELKNPDIMNIASGENISNQDIVDILNAQGYEIALKTRSPRENPPACDISKLKAGGINPQSLKCYLKNFMKEHYAAR